MDCRGNNLISDDPTTNTAAIVSSVVVVVVVVAIVAVVGVSLYKKRAARLREQTYKTQEVPVCFFPFFICFFLFFICFFHFSFIYFHFSFIYFLFLQGNYAKFQNEEQKNIFCVFFSMTFFGLRLFLFLFVNKLFDVSVREL